MVELNAPLATVSANLARVVSRIEHACERAGRDPGAVRVCVACKYVAPDALPVLASAGVKLVGENRLQDLVAKQASHESQFEWHFIGALQSRKVPEIASRVTMIHSLCSESSADRLNAFDGPVPAVLIQVNVSGEATKQGVAPGEIDALADRLSVAPRGLMTMPPPTADPEQARPYFRQLAQLAAERGYEELSMGTSQDFEVAVEEGATIVRIGSILFADVA